MKTKGFLAIALVAASLSSASYAAPPLPNEAQLAEALGQCFVMQTNGHDRLAVASWMLGSLASAPQMAEVAKVDSAKKVELDQAMAKLFTRLMTQDCAAQSRPLFKAKSEAGFRAAGEALGKIAVQELLGNPAASAALGSYANYLNDSDFKKLAE